MNTKIINLIKSVSFVLVLAISLTILNFTLKPKNRMDYTDSRSYEAFRIFDEPADTIDALILGHSGVYSAISPMEMYKKYGFTSYDLARARQTIWEAEKFLNDVLEKQNPQVLVLETDQIYYDKKRTYGETLDNLHENVPLLKNHATWKDWFYGKNYRERSEVKGYKIRFGKKPYIGVEYHNKMKPTDKKENYSAKHKKALDKIVATCQEKNIKVFFLELPSTILWDYKKHNAVKEYAINHGIEFVDMNLMFNELNFNWNDYTIDYGNHLNYEGAKIVSDYLGRKLVKEYGLESRKGNKKYAFWEKDLLNYENSVRVERNVQKVY